MAEMRIVQDSPTRITLELDPAWMAETSKTYAESIKRGRGCLFWLAAIFLLIVLIVGYSASTHALQSLSWGFWVFVVLFLAGAALFVLVEVYYWSSHREDAREATVTLDLEAGQAVRVAKSNAGKTTRNVLPLEQVTRVLVLGDDAIHTLKVTLESRDGSWFEVNSDVFFGPDPMLALGKKLGAFIDKPVVFRVTEAGKLISEETSQA